MGRREDETRALDIVAGRGLPPARRQRTRWQPMMILSVLLWIAAFLAVCWVANMLYWSR